MKSEIIGNSEIFAVEYSVEYIKLEVVYGPCKLWLRGQFLGDINDPIYLTGFLPDLQGLAYYFNRYEHFDDIPPVPASSTEFKEMFEDDNVNRYMIFIGAGFDRFYKLCFKNGETLVFYWCLKPSVANSPEDFPAYVDYPKGVHVAEVSISAIKEVADAFKVRLEELVSENKSKVT